MKPPLGDARPEITARAFYSDARIGDGEFVLVSRERDPENTEAELDRVITAVRTDGVTEAEPASAKARIVADHAADNYDGKSIAARYDVVAIGVPIDRIAARLAALAKVTPQDVHDVAVKYLDPRRAVTGWLLPEAPAAGEQSSLSTA